MRPGRLAGRVARGGTWRLAGGLARGVAWGLAWGLAAVGAVLLGALLRDTIVNGWVAYDARAYWLAARHLADGTPLYAPSLVTSFGAFKYPPIFAQLLLPAALLPDEAVDWLSRIASLLALRYLLGSWRAALVGTAVWGGFLLELQLGNVTLLLGAACLFALRDRRGAYLLPWFAALKFGPGLLMAYLWFRRPEWRASLLRGAAVFLGACAVSFAVAPSLWFDYLGTFGWETASTMVATGLIAVVPAHGGTDFAIRLAIAAIATGVAVRMRWDWLAFAAAAVTCPILTESRLAAVAGLWPLSGEWRARTGRRLRAWLRLRARPTRPARPARPAPVPSRPT